MHSSRMRTARLLPYRGDLCPGESLSGGVSVQGEGLCPRKGLYPGETPFLPDRMTDRCNNITFPQIRLRAVKMSSQ